MIRLILEGRTIICSLQVSQQKLQLLPCIVLGQHDGCFADDAACLGHQPSALIKHTSALFVPDIHLHNCQAPGQLQLTLMLPITLYTHTKKVMFTFWTWAVSLTSQSIFFQI